MQQLTNRTALIRQRARAQRQGAAGFLHEEARLELHERLQEINRSFTKVAIVTGHPEIWRDVLPGPVLVADDDVLDWPETGFDLVVHAMALHWANDPVGQIIQCARALRPDGLFMCITFGGRTLQELRTALAEAEASVTGGLAPRVAPMAEIRDLGSLLQRAGLALPVADAVPLNVEYAGLYNLLRDLRAMGEGNALAARDTRPLRRDVLARAEEIYCNNFTVNGRLAATFELVFLTGWAPHESQQLPLQPGSATTRLSDMLGKPDPASR